jgi:Uma2 family endonuclease
VDEYLAGEEASDIKHEYVGGAVYAMAGATREHNRLAQNIAFALRSHLKDKPCGIFISDIKLRLKSQAEDVFYYPDVMVGCDPRDKHPLCLRYPKILVEVSSASTERLDRHEKRLAYQAIETLEEYVLVAQDRVEVTIFRRADNWNAEVFNQLHQTITLKSIALTLPLSLVYEG